MCCAVWKRRCVRMSNLPTRTASPPTVWRQSSTRQRYHAVWKANPTTHPSSVTQGTMTLDAPRAVLPIDKASSADQESWQMTPPRHITVHHITVHHITASSETGHSHIRINQHTKDTATRVNAEKQNKKQKTKEGSQPPKHPRHDCKLVGAGDNVPP